MITHDDEVWAKGALVDDEAWARGRAAFEASHGDGWDFDNQPFSVRLEWALGKRARELADVILEVTEPVATTLRGPELPATSPSIGAIVAQVEAATVRALEAPSSLLAAPVGIYEDLPAEVYHRRELGLVNKGGLDQLRRSPAHYRAWAAGETEDEETEALWLGRALHTRVLEPELYAATYALQPYFGDGRKTEVKAAKAKWAEKNAGREAVEPAMWARIEGMAAAILAHPLARELLTGGRAEVTLRWDDPETGLPCKGRADYWRPDIDTAIDLKTCENASPEAFAKSVANYRYHVQQAHYCAGFAALGYQVSNFVFVAVEKRAPHAVLVAMLDDAATERGEGLYREEMETMAACVESGEWPAYGNGIQILTLPRWAA